MGNLAKRLSEIHDYQILQNNQVADDIAHKLKLYDSKQVCY